MRTRAAALPTLPLLAGLLACELWTGPGYPELELTRVTALPAYATWWDDVAQCSGLDGDIERVRFFRVDAPLDRGRTAFPCGSKEEGDLACSGVWQAPHDIYLAPAMLHVEALVRHEMLHDLLGAPGHPPVFEECAS